jgi:hypothetical protein
MATEMFKQAQSGDTLEVSVADFEAFENWQVVGLVETIELVDSLERDGEPVENFREVLEYDRSYHPALRSVRDAIFFRGWDESDNGASGDGGASEVDTGEARPPEAEPSAA